MKKYIYLSISLFFAALNFNLILNPLKLVTGGNQGLAILINKIIHISPAIIILTINIIMLIISYFTLSKETTYGTIAATFIYPLFVKLTSFIPTFNLQNNTIIYVIIAGIICGLTGGYIYKLGFTSGGISTLNLVINKYIHLKISLSNFIINTTIIIIGFFYFGLKKTIYSIIVIAIGSFIIHILADKSKKKY